ncbi:hypothetical protein [Desertivirga arenae]|uniref:hypothetical protein n=1 Tax=Desertivirga arenae TaxID=2810309 RepID=UPI001A960F43|nr:hypothetical protein [Pedobacter sp. SYSU D00823]
MDFTGHLLALGEEKLKVEIMYLQLRIEKALKAELFNKERLLNEAKELLDDISTEYFTFLAALQMKHHSAA